MFAAKAYGNNSCPAVLCVHGIQDNCDTFFTLLPLLPIDHYYFVCIDLPGHGQSVHFPAHVPLEFCHFVAAIKWIVDHFGWSNLAYLGHSFGGQLGAWFSGLYPERVRCLIILDTMGPRSMDVSDTVATVRGRIDSAQLMHLRQHGRQPPAYTFDEAIAKMKSGRPSKLSNESARILARRGLKDIGGGQFTFASDQRLKLDFWPVMTFNQHRQILSNIVCPTKFVLADQNCSRYSTYLKDQYEFYKQRPNMTIVVVSGDHDVHLNYPDRVSEHVSDFLDKNYSLLSIT